MKRLKKGILSQNTENSDLNSYLGWKIPKKGNISQNIKNKGNNKKLGKKYNIKTGQNWGNYTLLLIFHIIVDFSHFFGIFSNFWDFFNKIIVKKRKKIKKRDK